MYSNDQIQIRAGLVNYIGALAKSSPFKGKAAKQSVTSVLIEETLKLAQDENGVCDMYILKPMLKGTAFFLKQRVSELSKLPKSEAIETQVNSYKSTIEALENLVSMV
jgi:hypothetical protein